MTFMPNINIFVKLTPIVSIWQAKIREPTLTKILINKIARIFMDSHNYIFQLIIQSYMVGIHGFMQNSTGEIQLVEFKWILALGQKFLTLNL